MLSHCRNILTFRHLLVSNSKKSERLSISTQRVIVHTHKYGSDFQQKMNQMFVFIETYLWSFSSSKFILLGDCRHHWTWQIWLLLDQLDRFIRGFNTFQKDACLIIIFDEWLDDNFTIKKLCINVVNVLLSNIVFTLLWRLFFDLTLTVNWEFDDRASITDCNEMECIVPRSLYLLMLSQIRLRFPLFLRNLPFNVELSHMSDCLIDDNMVFPHAARFR